MECKKRNFPIFVLVAILLLGVNNGQPVPSNDADQSERDELRSMLNTVLEQNRRLTLQNKRLQQVWFGIQQLCTAVSMSTCDCEEGNISITTPPSKSPSSVTPPTQFPEKKSTSIKVLSIKSGGINMDPTPISVTYVATLDHTTYWIGYKESQGTVRSAGQIVRSRYDPNVFISTLNAEGLGNFSVLYFRLNNEDESLSIRLNLTEIETKQDRDVQTPNVDLLRINTSFVSPRDTDLTISGIVPVEYNDVDFFQASFAGVNTSTNPPVMFESLYGFQQTGCLDLAITNHTNTTSILNMTIKFPCAQFGGFLVLTMNYHEIKSTMWTELYYGPIIKIYSPDGNEVIPSKSLGIYPVPSETIITSSVVSLACYAIGNPKPDITIWKIRKDKKEIEMVTENLLSDNYTAGVVMTKVFKTTKQAEGKYMCRASNGFKTIEAPTDVVILKPAVFDESKTGVTKNTSESIVISCKAKGKPKPRLEFRLYYEYGPDITTTGMYTVRTFESSKHSSRITLTISANDTDIHQVYCFSKQGEPDMSHGVSKVIDVFPGIERKNWELFDNLTQAAQQGG